jgi:hypothetical protein
VRGSARLSAQETAHPGRGLCSRRRGRRGRRLIATRAEFAVFMKKEYDQWDKVVKERNISSQ